MTERTTSQVVRLKLEAASNWQSLMDFLSEASGPPWPARRSFYDANLRLRLNLEKFEDGLVVYGFTKRKPKHFQPHSKDDSNA